MRIDDLVVEVRDPNLIRIGQIQAVDLVGATFINRFNQVGTWTVTVPHGNRLGEFLRQPGYGIILTGPNGKTILSGPTQAAKLSQTQENIEGTWEISGASDEIYLAERLAYPTPSTDDVTLQTDDYDDRSGEAEMVIKSYVDVNAGNSAPASRRIANLIIEDNLNRGAVVSATARFDNLQELIYNLAQVGGIGYQVTQVESQLEFSVFEPQDRTATIRMDIQNRKLSSSILSYGTATVTRAIVGGKGEGKNRTFLERSSSDSLAAETTWNRRIETFIDARNANNVDELNTSGDELLIDQGKTITEMSVTPSDDINMVYGVDWFLGDRVTIVTNDIETSAVVTEIGIQIAEDGVRIGATVGTPIGIDFETKLLNKTTSLDSRISNLEKTTGYGINTLYIPGGGTIGGTQPVFNPADISGNFVRYGNIVTFDVQVNFTNITSFGTGQYYLTLPYPSKNEIKFGSGCLHDVSTGREYQIRAGVLSGESILKLSTTDSQGNRIFDSPFTHNDPVTLTTADRFHIGGTYEIEA